MKSKQTKLAIMISTIAAAVIFAAIGFFILPDAVVIQMTTSGARTVPKIYSLGIPLAISAVFSVMYYKSNITKHFVGSLAGIVIFILVYVFNL